MILHIVEIACAGLILNSGWSKPYLLMVSCSCSCGCHCSCACVRPLKEGAFETLWKISCTYMCESVSGISVLFHRSKCFHFLQCHIVLITVDLRQDLKPGRRNPPLLFISIGLAILVSLLSHINLEPACWSLPKILLGFWLELPRIYRHDHSLDWHISNIESSNLWTQYVFPFI